jgi:hypothetical protein
MQPQELMNKEREREREREKQTETGTIKASQIT